jgi:3D (Asp-Asp-Asp) domain-containing protein
MGKELERGGCDALKKLYYNTSILMILIFIAFSLCGISIAAAQESSEETILIEDPVMQVSYEQMIYPEPEQYEALYEQVKLYNRARDTINSYSITEEQGVEIDAEIEDSIGEYTITAYCPCEICCGEWANNRKDGIVYGAYGYELKAGVSVASSLPKNTKLKITGLDGEYIVQDTTADWVEDRYDGKIIDIYFNTHEEAVEFSKRKAEVYIIEED